MDRSNITVQVKKHRCTWKEYISSQKIQSPQLPLVWYSKRLKPKLNTHLDDFQEAMNSSVVQRCVAALKAVFVGKKCPKNGKKIALLTESFCKYASWIAAKPLTLSFSFSRTSLRHLWRRSPWYCGKSFSTTELGNRHKQWIAVSCKQFLCDKSMVYCSKKVLW